MTLDQPWQSLPAAVRVSSITAHCFVDTFRLPRLRAQLLMDGMIEHQWRPRTWIQLSSWVNLGSVCLWGVSMADLAATRYWPSLTVELVGSVYLAEELTSRRYQMVDHPRVLQGFMQMCFRSPMGVVYELIEPCSSSAHSCHDEDSRG